MWYEKNIDWVPIKILDDLNACRNHKTGPMNNSWSPHKWDKGPVPPSH